MRWLIGLLALLGVVETAWLALPYVGDELFPPEESAAVRGRRIAVRLGCFGCHGPDGVGGTANPGAEGGEVPAFIEQTQMMYVTGANELREYVLDGAPARRRADPEYVAKMKAAALHMPAYRGLLTASELDDLVAYLRAASGQIVPTAALAARGAAVAADLDCFRCHGPLGAGGVANPGSFKGYVPGFWGTDFDELVESDAELHAWIADGRIARIADHPVGGRFFERQKLKMPAYGRHVPAADVDALVAYVRWIRRGRWRSALE
jgi:mono/diheme cytochrome c family protein